MATYQPIQTGYKPEGALGALYAGENAAMARQQNQMANLADMFDQQQKDLTYRTGEFDLGEKQYMAPSKRAVSDLDMATAIGKNNPTYLTAMRGGETGQAQSLAAKGSLDTALLPLSITAGQTKLTSEVGANKQNSHITALLGANAALKQGGKMGAVKWVLDNYTDPDQRKVLLSEIELGKMEETLKSYAYTDPKHLAEMDKERYKGGVELEKARIAAAGMENSAKHGANAQYYAYNKDMLTKSLDAVEQGRKQLADNVKEMDGDLRSTIAKAGGKSTPQSIALEAQLTGAKTELTRLNDQHKQLFEQYKNLANFSGMPVAKGGGSTTVTQKVTGQAALDATRPVNFGDLK